VAGLAPQPCRCRAGPSRNPSVSGRFSPSRVRDTCDVSLQAPARARPGKAPRKLTGSRGLAARIAFIGIDIQLVFSSLAGVLLRTDKRRAGMAQRVQDLQAFSTDASDSALWDRLRRELADWAHSRVIPPVTISAASAGLLQEPRPRGRLTTRESAIALPDLRHARGRRSCARAGWGGNLLGITSVAESCSCRP
jgi:hypothetical protein